MKILLVNTSECTGGAAIACNRLMKALLSAGVDAKMLVRDKQTDDNNVISVNDSWIACKINRFRFLWERFLIWRTNCFSRKNLFAVSIANTGMDISRRREVQEADIIHIHWINHGFLSLADIKQLICLGKPIVWTMHDMWPCTGICHHARGCERYSEQCGDCPFLIKSGIGDLSSRVFKEKKSLSYKKIAFVACSDWLRKQSQKSALLKESRLLAIPNPLDIDCFRLLDKEKSRRHFTLPRGKKLLLFGAAKISNLRKGFEYLFNALSMLASKYPELNDELELVFVGKSELQLPESIPYKVNSLGYIQEDHLMAILYNAVDLYILPSLEENLPNMIMESMACGTPVVGFNTGGIPEMIDHKINGYVAEYKSSEDLMAGICWVLLKADYQKLSELSIQKVCAYYSEEKVSAQYIDLYIQFFKK